MARVRRAMPAAVLCAALALLTGCAEKGDFGRPADSLWNDLVLPSNIHVSSLSYTTSGSSALLTDDEQELRTRAWHYVTPAHDISFFNRLVAGMVQSLTVPTPVLGGDPSTYYNALMAVNAASPASRYKRLSDDMFADRGMMADFRAVAGRVISADRVRASALAHTPDLSEDEAASARARMQENLAVIVLVRDMVIVRICQYRYALDHLVVQSPQPDAVPVERVLAALERDSHQLDELDVGPLAGGTSHPETGPWTRPGPAVCRRIQTRVPQVRIQKPLVRKY